MSPAFLLHAVGHDHCVHFPAHVDSFRSIPESGTQRQRWSLTVLQAAVLDDIFCLIFNFSVALFSFFVVQFSLLKYSLPLAIKSPCLKVFPTHRVEIKEPCLLILSFYYLVFNMKSVQFSPVVCSELQRRCNSHMISVHPPLSIPKIISPGYFSSLNTVNSRIKTHSGIFMINTLLFRVRVYVIS